MILPAMGRNSLNVGTKEVYRLYAQQSLTNSYKYNESMKSNIESGLLTFKDSQ